MGEERWERKEAAEVYYHGGLSTKTRGWAAVMFSGRCCLHGHTRAHILKAEATGPRVPAIIGNAEEANHQRLQMSERLVTVSRGKQFLILKRTIQRQQPVDMRGITYLGSR